MRSELWSYDPCPHFEQLWKQPPAELKAGRVIHVHKCRKICWLGCVNRVRVHCIFLHICRCTATHNRHHFHVDKRKESNISWIWKRGGGDFREPKPIAIKEPIKKEETSKLVPPPTPINFHWMHYRASFFEVKAEAPGDIPCTIIC